VEGLASSQAEEEMAVRGSNVTLLMKAGIANPEKTFIARQQDGKHVSTVKNKNCNNRGIVGAEAI
jgi:hypothetical protein